MEFRWPRQRLSLHLWLIILILVVLIPTLTVVTMTLRRAGQSYREASSAQLLQTAHLVAQSIEIELRATAQIIERGAPLRGTPANVEGSLFGGRLKSSVVTPDPGNAGIRVASPADLARRAAATGKLEVSDIFMSANPDSPPQIAIAVPHRAAPGGIEVSTLVATPSALVHTLFREDAFAQTQLLAVTDGKGLIIARSREPEKFIGKPVPDWGTLTALHRPSGTFEARSIEGPSVVFAFHTIQGTPGWVAVVGEPLSAFNDRWRRPIEVMLVASAATLLFAFLLAIMLGRRILLPIRRLAQNARAIAAGPGPVTSLAQAAPHSIVAEFESLRLSLLSAEVETRRSHLAVQKSYDTLRQAEQLARIGSWTLDLASGHFSCSDMMYELNGADPAGPPLITADLRKLLAPESAARISAAFDKCAAYGQPYGMEVVHLRPDGTSFPAFVRGQAVRDDAGKIICVTGTVQDISERQEERERLATLADNLPSGVIFRLEEDETHTLVATYMSAGIIGLAGITAAQVMKDSWSFFKRIAEPDRTAFLNAMEHSRRTGGAIDVTFRVLGPDGAFIWMQTRSSPRRQQDGRRVWDGIARDVTGERLAADALHQAKEATEAAERVKAEFLATMSHEIRTPMNTVIGMTRLTLQTPLAPKQRNYLEKIDLSAKTLLGVINDVLDFSKISAGGLVLEDTPFSLDTVLESVSAVIAMPAEEKGLEIVYAVSADVPDSLRGDPLRLAQVLINLVGNAVKFTESGEVVISIAPLMADDGTSLLHFTVRDTGIGLSEDQISGLFRPFAQGGDDTFRKYGGTGLGLAICKQLVELMDGCIWAEGEPGNGSLFHFAIANWAPTAPALIDDRAFRASHLADRRVLIVDDNLHARNILGEMMASFGMVVEAVESGAGALARLRTTPDHDAPFDIVLIDWGMPGMDGLETARQMRSHDPLIHLPTLLMVTGYGREDVLRGVELLGLDGLLIKPVTASALFKTLADILAPRADQPAYNPVDGLAAHRRISPREAFPQLSGKRVLVVDDNALNREVAGDFLSIVGVEVETATDGLDALAKLEAREFDAVLMDIHMPRMDGLAAVREIRGHDRWSTLPVIALTAQAGMEDQKASDAGMTAHLSKPIVESVLYGTLAHVLGLTAAKSTIARDRDLSAMGDSGFSLAAALRSLGGNALRVERMLDHFLRDNADTERRLADHIQMRDGDAAAELAHAIRGSAAYFGARDFCAAADRLERAARGGDMPAVQAHSLAFGEELARLREDGHRVLARLRDAPPHGHAPLHHDRMMALIARATPLVHQGDYAASTLLEEICGGLSGQAGFALARAAQAHFDELDIAAAGAALAELHAHLWSAREHVS